MKKIGLAIAFFTLLVSMSHAQRVSSFEYQVHRLDSIHFEIQLQLQQPDSVQFVEVYFLKGNNELAVDMASLNKKRGGKFYLYHNGREERVDPRYMSLNVTHEFGTLRGQTVLIKLLDREFNQLDAQEKAVDH